jgi:acyl carrier protein phosphodiesterase
MAVSFYILSNHYTQMNPSFDSVYPEPLRESSSESMPTSVQCLQIDQDRLLPVLTYLLFIIILQTHLMVYNLCSWKDVVTFRWDSNIPEEICFSGVMILRLVDPVARQNPRNKQRRGKYDSTTIERLLETVFSMWSVPRRYLEDNWGDTDVSWQRVSQEQWGETWVVYGRLWG